ncbi:MAG: 3-deoxy-8-phosphooctulonate synthase [Ignavibacteriae bacterium HGW-Ignavibacteriae-3]|nr:MAG: 3-deoxy-8-phosphooctulonate synthase [Ignavibacteriae bacterium HGW-Ignavibacteriae-3]
MIKINKVNIGGNQGLVLIAGPCVIENEKITMYTAGEIKRITSDLNIPFIFKASYRKANRTNIHSFSGIHFEKALKILQKVKREFSVPILTDIHSEKEIEPVAEVADVLQIPAFLCRQTDLLVAAAMTRRVINVKKGQFLAPQDMKHVVQKIESVKNKKILLTERGTTFGYHNLVVDMRSLQIMKDLGYPVIMDATHAVQLPSNTSISGGEARFIPALSKAATAVGIDGLFLEVHPDPSRALSDSGSQLPLHSLKRLLITIKKIDELVKNEN